MFKYKVSVYMRSGNVIYLKVKQRSKYKMLFLFFHLKLPEEFFELYTYAPIEHIDFKQVEAIIIKKWWQRWG